MPHGAARLRKDAQHERGRWAGQSEDSVLKAHDGAGGGDVMAEGKGSSSSLQGTTKRR
jgi:hypothetical protein